MVVSVVPLESLAIRHESDINCLVEHIFDTINQVTNYIC